MDESYKLGPVIHELQLANIIDRPLELIVLQRPAIMADSKPDIVLALATIRLVLLSVNVKLLDDVIPVPVPKATSVESIETQPPPPLTTPKAPAVPHINVLDEVSNIKTVFSIVE